MHFEQLNRKSLQDDGIAATTGNIDGYLVSTVKILIQRGKGVRRARRDVRHGIECGERDVVFATEFRYALNEERLCRNPLIRVVVKGFNPFQCACRHGGVKALIRAEIYDLANLATFIVSFLDEAFYGSLICLDACKSLFLILGVVAFFFGQRVAPVVVLDGEHSI